MRFVIADDSKIGRKVLADILGRLGHAVVAECDNASAAIDACEKHRPDVAILDIAMPGNDSGKHVSEIFASGTASRVIIASILVGHEREPLLDRFDPDILRMRKPFTEADVLAALSQL